MNKMRLTDKTEWSNYGMDKKRTMQTS
jgi:hypothetical protein